MVELQPLFENFLTSEQLQTLLNRRASFELSTTSVSIMSTFRLLTADICCNWIDCFAPDTSSPSLSQCGQEWTRTDTSENEH